MTVAAGATLAVAPQVAAVVPALVNSGLVDVGLGGLTVKSGQTAAGVVAGIKAGRTEGTWSGTAGITSNAAATQSERAVGWLDNGDGSFTVAFGAAGDWNLNGVVDFDDVVASVSANLFDAGPYNTPTTGAALTGLGFGSGDPAPMNGGVVAVPEPATWLLAVLGITLPLLAVRRLDHPPMCREAHVNHRSSHRTPRPSLPPPPNTR